MAELLSVGLDVGTTTTQLVVSELTVENRGSAFSVPEMVIEDRAVRHRSPVIFTPQISGELVDGQAIAQWVSEQYTAAGITKEQVDTGAVIITGETSRKENAREVLNALAGFAGDFVVATAGPDLESVLAAKGAGATDYSAKTGKTVLHIDIGGGTSNFAYIAEGNVVATGCLNVGGRLLTFDENGKVTYKSPVLEGLFGVAVGDTPMLSDLEKIAEKGYDSAICFNDVIALEYLSIAKEKVNIVSFDNIRSKFTLPVEFQSVTSSKIKMSHKAIKILLDAINGDEEIKKVILPTKLS